MIYIYMTVNIRIADDTCRAKTNKADIYEQDRFFFSQFKYVRPVREFINGFILFDAIAMQGTACLFDGDGAASVLEEFPIIACFGEKRASHRITLDAILTLKRM